MQDKVCCQVGSVVAAAKDGGALSDLVGDVVSSWNRAVVCGGDGGERRGVMV